MVLFYILRRVSSAVDPDSPLASSSVNEQSPLHVLPTPILVLLALACLLLAACVAGLTLGLMSLDPLTLDIVRRSNNPQAAEAARRIKPVREQGNLLLVTLLFANTLATELLPLVLEALVPGGYFSLVTSVVSIMLFGEIIPQAVCSRHPLIIGSSMIGFVRVLRILLYPVSFPIAYVLDRLLGKELGTVYNREELKGLIEVHRTNHVLTQDETTILKGALEFSEKTVAEICTPAEKVFKLDIDSQLDRDTLLSVLRSGHSRIPLYEGTESNIVCLLLVKQLILVNPLDEVPIRSLISKKKKNYKVRVAPALECEGSTLISDLLNEFQKGRSHMAIVYDDIGAKHEDREFIGIVSIEDIIEEILQEEIVDETDRFTDNTFTTKVLVRSPDGNLVRASAISSKTVHVPGTSTAMVVKEIEVPALKEPLSAGVSSERIQGDLKKQKTRRKLKTLTDSPTQPLLGPGCTSDNDSGYSQVDLEGGLRDSPSVSRRMSITRGGGRAGASRRNMQYARIPSMSSNSIMFGEDDTHIPEDFCPHYGDSLSLTVSEAIENVRAETGTRPSSGTCEVASETKSQLKMRPLPEHASDEREVEIPRQRAGMKKTPDNSSLMTAMNSISYGSIADDEEQDPTNGGGADPSAEGA